MFDAEMPATKAERYEISVFDTGYADALKRVASLRKIAASHGQRLEIVGQARTDRTVMVMGYPMSVGVITLTIEAEEVLGARGKVLGHFERAEDGKSIYTHVFEEGEIVHGFAGREEECEHCGVRRSRRNTFVCRIGDDVKIIGANCLKGYLGIDMAGLMAWAGARRVLGQSLWEDDMFFGAGASFYETSRVLEACFKVAKSFAGYAKARREEMRYDLNLIMHGSQSERDQKTIEAYRQMTVDWNLQSLVAYFADATGEFGQNLRTAVGQERVSQQRWGLILAGVGLYVGRALQKASDAEAAARLPAAKHVDAAEKERIERACEVLRTQPYETQYGCGTIITMRCDDGSNLLQYCKGENTPEAGKRYVVRATVKKHTIDKVSQEPVTIVSRAIFKPVEA